MINSNQQPVLLDMCEISENLGNQTTDPSNGSPNSVYTKFDQLTDFYAAYQDFGTVFDALRANTDSKHDWKVHFELLEHLRILNKFHYPELNLHLTWFTDFIIQCIDSLRSNLSKDALLFLTEVVPQTQVKELPAEFLSKIVPLICDKAISDLTFIKSEAKIALKSIEKHCAGDAAILALSEKSFDKNVAICELAFQSLCELVKTMNDNIQHKITLGGCKTLFRTLLRALHGKRTAMKKYAESSWLHLKAVLQKVCDIESFLECKVGLLKSEVTMLMGISANKKKKNYGNDRAQFQSFMKERKMMIESDNTHTTLEEEPTSQKITQPHESIAASDTELNMEDDDEI